MIRSTLFASVRLLCLTGLFAGLSLANSSGPITGVAGAPGENNCTLCHNQGGAGLNAGGGSLKVELLNGTKYVPGQQHRLRVTLADPAARRWGFQLTARLTANSNSTVGNLASDTTPVLETKFQGALQFINHTSQSTFLNQTGSASWEFFWTAPSSNVGTVTFYAAGNAANGNGANTGDNIYTTSLTVEADTSGNQTSSRVLPQFVFGQDSTTARWYTALYLTNTTGAPKTANIHFRDDTGNDLDVPGFGPTPTINLPANGTTVIESPMDGAFKQGWAQVSLPDGVTGYGVFRQNFGARAPQEAVVLLSDDSKPAYNLTFDDNGLTTTFAAVNSGDTAINLQIVARDAAGTQIGATQVTIAARQKIANALRLIPGLEGINTRRGSAEFRVGAGKVAVLGLRFGAEAFTSIPTTERQ